MFSIYDWFGYNVTLEKRYSLIKNAGFSSVMMWWSNGFGRDIHGLDEYRKGPKIARDRGLYIENIHAPVDNQNSLWQYNLEGNTLKETYLKCIEDCNTYEIPTMVIHTPNDDYEINQFGIDRIKELVEKAEKNNVNIALENMRNLANLQIIFESIGSSKLGFCYDSCHHYSRYPETDLLSMFGSRLMAVHLHDNNGEFGQHGLPFDGTSDWNKIMKNIADCNYKGCISIEPMNWDYQNLKMDEFLGEAYKKGNMLKSLWDESTSKLLKADFV